MNKFYRLKIFFLLASTLIGCGAIYDFSEDEIKGSYSIGWIDLEENRSLLYNRGEIVGPYIYAIGFNEKYIIAKQHPLVGVFGKEKLITGVTNYYIIEMNENSKAAREKIFGPINIYQFDSIRKKLKIESIQFDKLYEKNPHGSDFYNQIVESYYVGYEYSECTRAIESNEILITPYVFEIGHDQNYIIAKQHPFVIKDGNGRINSDIENYFVIQIKHGHSSNEEQIWGPYKFDQFDSLSKTLKIEHIKFDIKYPDIPEDYCK
jgi:hypothetical protein